MSPPRNDRAAGLERRGEAEVSNDDDRHRTRTETARQEHRIPSNTRMVGLLLDREHVSNVSEIIRVIQNQDAAKLLAHWRCSLDQFCFCVVSGGLDQPHGGIVGGLAKDWPAAKSLLEYVRAKFDAIGLQGNGFTSAWVLHLTGERRDEIYRIIAATMHTAGNA